MPHTTEDYRHAIFTLKGRFAKGNEIVSAYGKKLSPTLSSHPKRTVSFARSFHINAWSPVYGELGIGDTVGKHC